MKTRKLLLVSFLLVLVLTACGGGSDGGDPVGAVKNVVAAMEKLDVEEASKYVCEAQQSELDMESAFADIEAMGIDPQEFLDAFNIDFKDMKYEEKSQDGDNAVVHVSGKASLNIDEEKMRPVVEAMIEASGEEVSDEMVDMAMAMFASISGQEAPVDGDVKLVKEGDEWRVCDELDFLDEALDTGF